MSLGYQLYGSFAKIRPPLIMIHGFLCGGDFFKPNIETLSKHFPIITIDLPGFGESTHHISKDSIEEMANLVINTIDDIGVQRYHLLGHSMGGMVALNMTKLNTNRIEKLIAYATHSDGNLTERFETFAETKKRLNANFSQHVENAVATWFMAGQQHHYFAMTMQCAKKVTLKTALNALTAMQNFNMTNELQKLTIPVLIIAAEFDKTYTQKTIHKLRNVLPKAQYRLIKNVAHNAHLEDKTTFNKIVLNFLTT